MRGLDLEDYRSRSVLICASNRRGASRLREAGLIEIDHELLQVNHSRRAVIQ